MFPSKYDLPASPHHKNTLAPKSAELSSPTLAQPFPLVRRAAPSVGPSRSPFVEHCPNHKSPTLFIGSLAGMDAPTTQLAVKLFFTFHFSASRGSRDPIHHHPTFASFYLLTSCYSVLVSFIPPHVPIQRPITAFSQLFAVQGARFGCDLNWLTLSCIAPLVFLIQEMSFAQRRGRLLRFPSPTYYVFFWP